MPDNKIEPTPVTESARTTAVNPNWNPGDGQRKKKDLRDREDDEANTKTKTPFGPSLLAFRALANDKAAD